jgi:hypothetical protein
LLCEEALVDLYEPMLICGTFFPHMDRRVIGKVLYHLESLCFGPGEMVIARHKPASGLHVVCVKILLDVVFVFSTTKPFLLIDLVLSTIRR